MDAVAVIFEGIPVIFYFLLFIFIPGFLFSLVIFPRKNSLSSIDRLVYSTVLGTSSGIVLAMIMFSVLRLDITPVNFILAAVVFSAVLLMVWVCERGYLNKQARERRKPYIPADQQHPRIPRTKTAAPERDAWTVVPRPKPARTEQGSLPPVILPGWRGKDQEVQARDIREGSREQPEARPGSEPARMAPEGLVRAVPEKVPQGSGLQPGVLPREIRKRKGKQAAAGPKEIPVLQKVQARVQVKESRKQAETKIVVASIRKLQKDIQRDLDKVILTQDSLTGTEKNIENIRIPKKADIDKKLAELNDELKDLDWLSE